MAARKPPKVRFRALRHSHASAPIASGLDVLTVSRRLGHGSAVVNSDAVAAHAIKAALGMGAQR